MAGSEMMRREEEIDLVRKTKEGDTDMPPSNRYEVC
jgi:hypothetical protein